MQNPAESESPLRSFRDLIAWQKGMLLVEQSYAATATFPREEVYGLVSQMRRAAVSVVSNIAEGQARRSRGEFLHFLGQARGSLAELETQTVLAGRLGFLSSETEKSMIDLASEVGRLINGLRNSLERPKST